VPRAVPKPSLLPVTQSLAAPGAPGASPLRAEARTGEARTGEAPNPKTSAAAEPSVMTVRIRARMICTSVVSAEPQQTWQSEGPELTRTLPERRPPHNTQARLDKGL
jgi:hypothetical protein